MYTGPNQPHDPRYFCQDNSSSNVPWTVRTRFNKLPYIHNAIPNFEPLWSHIGLATVETAEITEKLHNKEKNINTQNRTKIGPTYTSNFSNTPTLGAFLSKPMGSSSLPRPLMRPSTASHTFQSNSNTPRAGNGDLCSDPNRRRHQRASSRTQASTKTSDTPKPPLAGIKRRLGFVQTARKPGVVLPIKQEPQVKHLSSSFEEFEDPDADLGGGDDAASPKE
ncbi:hypothetical protein EV426DRAFT_578728 [Tirmania nivea]|nr:hypothetical protein EV426DRAFT_578728 [Tirmania nivea]